MARIYLVGPRACGKTTVGRAVAAALQFDFYDSDALIVQRAGCKISDFVDKKGWDAFRDLESEVLKSVSRLENSVISCGGGIIVRDENSKILKDEFTVYLKTDIDTLVKRLSANPDHGQRPSLTGKPLSEEVREVLDAREELYSDCATITVNGAGRINDLCSEIIDAFKLNDNGDGK